MRHILGSCRISSYSRSRGLWRAAPAGAAVEGDEVLTVASASGWRAGDRIVVVPTDSPDSNGASNTYDEAIIESVSGNQVTLETALAHDHPVVQGKWRAEVLNLTRNVVISGTESG